MGPGETSRKSRKPHFLVSPWKKDDDMTAAPPHNGTFHIAVLGGPLVYLRMPQMLTMRPSNCVSKAYILLLKVIPCHLWAKYTFLLTTQG